MRKLFALLFCAASLSAATKPVSPAWQSGNSLASGVVRYYYVQSSTTTITDFVPGGHNLTISGTPTLAAAPGGVGNEYDMGGTASASGSDTGLPTGASAWSVAGFVKTTSALVNTGGEMGILSWGTATAGQQNNVCDSNYNGLSGSQTANALSTSPIGSVQTGTTAINDGVYHRVVVTYDGTNIRFYVDGTFQRAVAVSLNITLNGTVNTGTAHPWTGQIGDLVIWSRTLSSGDVTLDNADPWQEVRSGVSKPLTPAWQSGNSLASGVVRYYYVDSSTTTMTDYVPSGHNLTVTGTAALTTAPGGVGNEYDISWFGTSSMLSGADTGLPNGASAWSVAAYFKTTQVLTSSGRQMGIAAWGTPSGTGQYANICDSFWTDLNGSNVAQALSLSPTGSVQTGTTAINDGAWHRGVVTYDGSTVRFYVDGAFQQGLSVSLNITLNGTAKVAEIFTGQIGDVVIWNRTLSSGDVTTDFTDPWQEVRPPGAPVPGVLSKTGLSGLTTVSLTTGVATSGTSPYAYQWQRSAHGAGVFSNVGTNSTTLNDTGLSTGTNYDYRVIVTDGASQTVTSGLLAIITLFPMDTANIGYTPGSWFISGSSPAAFASTIRGGSEARFTFTGTSAALAMSMANIGTPTVLGVDWQIDLATRQFGNPAAGLTLVTGLSAGTHNAYFRDTANPSNLNAWNVNGSTPDYAVTVIGIQLDVGATIGSAITVQTDKFAFFGDSVTAGAFLIDSNLGAAGGCCGDTFLGYQSSIAAAFNSEPATNAFSSSGWTVTVTGSNLPPFATALTNYWNGQSRTLTGLFKRALVMHGNNDGNGAYQATITSDMTLLRSTLGGATKIYVVVPFALGIGRTPITTGFTTYCGSVVSHGLPSTGNYLTCTNDASAYLIDLGSAAQVGFGSGPSYNSNDGSHPLTRAHERFGGMLTQAIQQIEGGTGTTGSYSLSFQ